MISPFFHFQNTFNRLFKNCIKFLLGLTQVKADGTLNYDKIYLTLFYLREGRGAEAKLPYPSVFLKYLQNYLLTWLEIFKVWFSNCFKAFLKKMMKIGVRKALNYALSRMTSYRKKSRKIFFSFFSIIFYFLLFPCCVC